MPQGKKTAAEETDFKLMVSAKRFQAESCDAVGGEWVSGPGRDLAFISRNEGCTYHC